MNKKPNIRLQNEWSSPTQYLYLKKDSLVADSLILVPKYEISYNILRIPYIPMNINLATGDTIGFWLIIIIKPIQNIQPQSL